MLRAGVPFAEGDWLRAERQSGGRGRDGRRWESPPGNLYCSTLIDLREYDPPAQTLSFVIGLAVCDLVRAQLMLHAPVRLKWPNDVLFDGRKIAGILLERSGDHVIVGIGVNVAVAPQLPDRETACLHEANGRNANDSERVLDFLRPRVAARLAQWRLRGVAPILRAWQRAAHPRGTPLAVRLSDGTVTTGRYAGLEPDGALRLDLDEGGRKTFYSGDVGLL